MKSDLQKDLELEQELYQELEKLLAMEIDERGYLELKPCLNRRNVEKFRTTGNDEAKFLVLNGKKEIPFNGTKEIQRYFEHICWKEIASFLNTNGGRLYIGVTDEANPETKRRDIIDVYVETREGEQPLSVDKMTRLINDKLETFFDVAITRRERILEKYLKVIFLKNDGKYVLVIDVTKAEFSDWPVLINKAPPHKDGKPIFVRRKNDEAQIETDINVIVELTKSKFVESKFSTPPFTKTGWSDDEFQIISYLVRQNELENDPPQTVILHNRGVSLDVFSQLTPLDGDYDIVDIESSSSKLLKDLSYNLGNSVLVSFAKKYEEIPHSKLDGAVNTAIEQIFLQSAHKDISYPKTFEVLSASIVEAGKIKEIWDIPLLKLGTDYGDFFAIPEYFGHYIESHNFIHEPFFVDVALMKANAMKKFPNEQIADPEWYGDEKWKSIVGSTVSGRVVSFEEIRFVTILHVATDLFEVIPPMDISLN